MSYGTRDKLEGLSMLAELILLIGVTFLVFRWTGGFGDAWQLSIFWRVLAIPAISGFVVLLLGAWGVWGDDDYIRALNWRCYFPIQFLVLSGTSFYALFALLFHHYKLHNPKLVGAGADMFVMFFISAALGFGSLSLGAWLGEKIGKTLARR